MAGAGASIGDRPRSALTIRQPGPVPLIPARSMPFASAIRAASGLTRTLPATRALGASITGTWRGAGCGGAISATAAGADADEGSRTPGEAAPVNGEGWGAVSPPPAMEADTEHEEKT